MKSYIRNIVFKNAIKIGTREFKENEIVNPRNYKWHNDFIEFLERENIVKVNRYNNK